MKIEAKVTIYEKDNIKALAMIKLDEVFMVSGIRVIEGKKGLFVSMPSKKTNKKDENGNVIYQDIAYPLTFELRDEISKTILEMYHQQKEAEQ